MEKIADINKYKSRIVDKNIERYLSIFGALCIEGPKWCGKSWTSSFHSNSEILLGDPTNNFQNKQMAELSPSKALEGETPHLIDEWQEVVSIWDATRFEVDRRHKKGQFILTGSSTPRNKGVLHSGIGRIAKIKMSTMSLYETGDSTGCVSLKDLFNGNFETQVVKDLSLDNLTYLICRGGWPENIGIPREDVTVIPNSYIDTLLNEDVYKLDDKEYNITKMRLLLRSLARNESTTIRNSKLIDDMKENEQEKIDDETLVSYLDVFKRMFILDNQTPFSPQMRSKLRIKQAEKRHFCDVSLAASLLKATPDSLINDLETLGFLFESLVEHDLRIYAQAIDANLYHYQDYNNNEIDAIIELKDGSYGAFEIKLGSNQIDKAAKNLIKVKNSIINNDGKGPKILCVIVGLGNFAYQREDGVYVIPINALKD